MQLSYIVLGPVVTEKSTRLQEQNKHVFRVHKDATKIDVINFFREFYKVVPKGVCVLTLPLKARRIGRSRTMTKRGVQKRAIVTLEKGQSIELVGVKKSDKKPKPVKKEVVSGENEKK